MPIMDDLFNLPTILFDPSLNWLPFLGSIIGGLCTLGGVLITIRYSNNKERNKERKEAEPLICLEIVDSISESQCDYHGNIVYEHNDAPFHLNLMLNAAVLYRFSSERQNLGGIVIHNVGIKPALNLKFTLDIISSNKNNERIGLKVPHTIGVIYGEKKYTMAYTIYTSEFYLWNGKWSDGHDLIGEFTFDDMIQHHHFSRLGDPQKRKELLGGDYASEMVEVIYSMGSIKLEYEDVLHNKYQETEKIVSYFIYHLNKHLEIKWEVIPQNELKK